MLNRKNSNQTQKTSNENFNLSPLKLQHAKFCPKQELNMMILRQSHGRWYNKNILNREYRIKVLFGIFQKTNQMLELKISTFCSSIHIFDSMISKYPIDEEKMIPLSFVAMQLASKINEPQEKIISYGDLNEYILPFGVEQFKEMEKIILNTLNFRINVISPHSFLVFLLNEFLKDKYDFFESSKNFNINRKDFLKIVFHLLLITLVDYEFYQFTSFSIAVTIIILARHILKLKPWTKEMKNFTNYSKEDVKESILNLNQRFQSKYLGQLFKKIDNSFENNENFNSNNKSSLVDNTSEYFLNKENVSSCITSYETKILRENY